MLIIEAFNINTGGAKKLLLYLIKILKSKNIDCTVSVKDAAIIDEIKGLEGIKILSATKLAIIKRLLSKQRNCIYFGNLPPMRKQLLSILYIHNEYFTLSLNELLRLNLPLKSVLKISALKFYLLLFHRNVTYIACQTSYMKNRLEKMLNRKIIKIPFYEPEVILKKQNKIYDICYIGLPSNHKNHFRFLKVLKQIAIDGIPFCCAVTVPLFPSNENLVQIISEINKIPNCSIKNFEICSKEQISIILEQSKAMIFPSLAESFGLPVIEALQHGLLILSSDLPFTYELIINPITFNPLNEEDMKNKLNSLLKGKYDQIVQKLAIDNEIETLIELVSKNEDK